MDLGLEREIGCRCCVEKGQVTHSWLGVKSWGKDAAGVPPPQVSRITVKRKEGCSFTERLLCAGILYKDHLSRPRNHEVGPCR